MKKLMILLFILAISIISNAQQATKALEMVKEGIALHDKGDYEAAIAKYDKALEFDSNNQLAMGEKAYSLHASGKEEEAITLCNKILELYRGFPDLAQVYITLGNSLDAVGKPVEAMNIYNEGIEKFPTENMLYFNKGITLTSNEKYNEALESFEMAAKINPEHPGTNNAIGRILIMQQNKIPALLALTRFMILEPTGQRAASNLDLIRDILKGNVEQKGKNNVTIYVNENDLSKDGENKAENDFSGANLILSMSAALDYDKKYKNETETASFIRKIDLVCGYLSETKKDNSGFYWDFYAPYFIALKTSGFIETLAYIVYASTNNDNVVKWLDKNNDAIVKFYDWSSAYVWGLK